MAPLLILIPQILGMELLTGKMIYYHQEKLDKSYCLHSRK